MEACFHFTKAKRLELHSLWMDNTPLFDYIVAGIREKEEER